MAIPVARTVESTDTRRLASALQRSARTSSARREVFTKSRDVERCADLAVYVDAAKVFLIRVVDLHSNYSRVISLKDKKGKY